MNYLVYDLSGKILRYGICPEGDFLHQASNPGETVMEGQADDSKHYIVEGKIVEFSTAIKAEKGALKQVRQEAEDKEATIRQKMDYILRKQAISELTKEGKL